jgi:hypothetical protein
MKKVIEYLLIFLISFSIIEFASIILALFLYSSSSYTNVEAITNSRIIALELFTCAIAAVVYNKVLSKKKR